MKSADEKRTIYLDLRCGITSTLFLGALIDAGLGKRGGIEEILQHLIPNLKLDVKSPDLNGERALLPVFSPPDSSYERSWREVKEILGRIPVREAKMFALRVFSELAEAEARAHGVPVDEVHFHEVGNLQNILSVAGIGIVFSAPKLRNVRILSSPLYPGKGTVKTAHGILPIPAPATAFLLEGLPVRESETIGEITTPTGAALIRAINPEFREFEEQGINKAVVGRGTDGRRFSDCQALLRLWVYL